MELSSRFSRTAAIKVTGLRIFGKGKLESFLEEFPPIDANISKAHIGLTEAKRYLLSTANEQGKKLD